VGNVNGVAQGMPEKFLEAGPGMGPLWFKRASYSVQRVVSRHRLREFTRISTWTDLIAIVSFLAPLPEKPAAFSASCATLRLLREYQVLMRLRADSPFFSTQ